MFGVKILNHFSSFTSSSGVMGCISTDYSSSLSSCGMSGTSSISSLIPPGGISPPSLLSSSGNSQSKLKALGLFLIAVFFILCLCNLLSWYVYISSSVFYNLKALSDTVFLYLFGIH